MLQRGPRSLALLAVVVALGCSQSPPRAAPLPSAAPAPPAAPLPSAAPAPTAGPEPPPVATAPAPVDRHTCVPRSPAVRFEIEDDDVVRPIDAAGCPLGESHCKANGYGYAASVDFMTELERRVRAGDKAGLSELANYPLRVNGKRALVVKDRAAFLREVDRIYSPPVVEAILKADPRDVFCNAQGIMLGSGVVWADAARGEHYGVIAVNPP